jgi:hypothetical protein
MSIAINGYERIVIQSTFGPRVVKYTKETTKNVRLEKAAAYRLT